MSANPRCVYPFPSLVIHGGRAVIPLSTWPGEPETREELRDVRLSFWNPEGKPWDWERAWRLAHALFPAGVDSIALEHDGRVYAAGEQPEHVSAVRKRGPSAADLRAAIRDFLAGNVSRDVLAALAA